MRSPSHWKKALLGIGLLAGIVCIGVSVDRWLRSDDADFFTFEHHSLEWVERQRKAWIDIAHIGIGPSQDAWRLFEEFTKRFSLVPISEKREGLRDIPSIAKTRGGSSDELVFVLFYLFLRNGIEAEQVAIHVDQQIEPVGEIERMLVYVPAIDQHFDPTLPVTQQPKGSGRTLFSGKLRVYRPGPVGNSVLARSYYRR